MEQRWEFTYEHESSLTRVGHVRAVVTKFSGATSEPQLRVSAHYYRKDQPGAAFDPTVEEKKFTKQCEMWALTEVRNQLEPQA